MKLQKLLLALVICNAAFNLRISTATAQDVVAAAKKEGEVLLYLSTNLADANGMIQLFKQKYPFINVKFFRADNEKLPEPNSYRIGDGKIQRRRDHDQQL